MSLALKSHLILPRAAVAPNFTSSKIKVDPKIQLDLPLENLYIRSHSDIHLPCSGMGLTQGIEEIKLQLNELGKIASKSDGHTVLIANGDIFEILESYIWKYGELYSDNNGKIEDIKKVMDTFLDILSNNVSVVSSIQQFLKSPKAEIIFVEGNHDVLLFRDDDCGNILRSVLRDILMPDTLEDVKDEKIKFVRSGKMSELNLYFEHGHRFDSYDYSEEGKLTWGDWLSYVKVNVVKRLITEIQNLKGKDVSNGGLPDDLVDTLIKKIGNVEYIRSANAFGLYLKHIVERYSEKYKKKNEFQIAKNIKKAFAVGADEFAIRVKDAPFTLSGFPLKVFPQCILKSNLMRNAFMYGTSYIYSVMTHRNDVQLKAAKNIVQEDSSIELLTFGHTHMGGITQGFIDIDDIDKQISVYNSGTRLPVKLAIVERSKVNFGKIELHETSGCTFKTEASRKGSQKLKAIAHHSISTSRKIQ